MTPRAGALEGCEQRWEILRFLLVRYLLAYFLQDTVDEHLCVDWAPEHTQPTAVPSSVSQLGVGNRELGTDTPSPVWSGPEQ